MHKIKLYRTRQGWVAMHTDPAIKELFGSDTIPTAFTERAEANEVLQAIKALNPDRIVELRTT